MWVQQNCEHLEFLENQELPRDQNPDDSIASANKRSVSDPADGINDTGKVSGDLAFFLLKQSEHLSLDVRDQDVVNWHNIFPEEYSGVGTEKTLQTVEKVGVVEFALLIVGQIQGDCNGRSLHPWAELQMV